MSCCGVPVMVVLAGRRLTPHESRDLLIPQLLVSLAPSAVPGKLHPDLVSQKLRKKTFRAAFVLFPSHPTGLPAMLS